MRQNRGIWLPDGDKHFALAMMKDKPRRYLGAEVGVYQHDKLRAAIEATQDRNVAVDVGAHVGFWSMWLCLSFTRVIAFEPCREHVECFKRNVLTDNIELHPFAVGNRADYVSLERDRVNSGRTAIGPGKEWGTVRMVTLDSMQLPRVNLLKIDVEGYEAAVLEGGRAMIQEYRPTIALESNGQHTRHGLAEPVKLLQSWGARVLRSFRHDHLMGWQ